MKLCSWEEAKRSLILHTFRKVQLQTLFRMKGCSSTKSGILWDTTKSMKFHHMEPASLCFPRSLIVRAMRGQSAISSPSKQTIMIFRAVTNTIYYILIRRKNYLHSRFNFKEFIPVYCVTMSLSLKWSCPYGPSSSISWGYSSLD